jgi:glycosyltransferase involved in cell wall biosynthesis
VYNTPFLISPLFKSFDKCHPNTKFKKIVVNTSDREDLISECEDALSSVNLNTIIRLPGKSHGEAVNIGLSLANTKHVLLVDSDIIFYKNFIPILKRMIDGDFVLGGEVVGNRGGKNLHPRVQPWYCYINLDFIKSNNINFVDIERTRKSKEHGHKIYDIGSTMFEDVINCGGKIANFSVEGNYFKHYEGMSWHSQKFNPNDVDTDIDFSGTHPHKVLYDIGTRTKEIYLKDTMSI